MANNNFGFDEVVEGEDLLGAFESAEVPQQLQQQTVSQQPSVQTASTQTVVQPQENKMSEQVTISMTDFQALINSVKALTAEVQVLKNGTAQQAIPQTLTKAAEKPAAAAKPKRTRAEYLAELSEKNKAKATERFTQCVNRSGKSEAEVKAAFKLAHSFAAEDQSQYKARFDTKLVELIGVKKYAA